ncbi:MAG: hypothetical protein V1744_04675 [Candidatus Altiarchaeota archaeon]
MNLRGLIRPTKTRILLAAILFFLLPVPVTNIPVFGGPAECSGQESCILGYTNMWAPFGGTFLVVAPFVGGNDPFETVTDYLWKTPYLIVTAYLLACCVAHAVNVIRKARY